LTKQGTDLIVKNDLSLELLVNDLCVKDLLEDLIDLDVQTIIPLMLLAQKQQLLEYLRLVYCA